MLLPISASRIQKTLIDVAWDVLMSAVRTDLLVEPKLVTRGDVAGCNELIAHAFRSVVYML
jgi:hypothetical protein